jgi:hypothetical protein
MSNFLSTLTESEQAQLLEELNYMNLEEIRGFCSERGPDLATASIIVGTRRSSRV